MLCCPAAGKVYCFYHPHLHAGLVIGTHTMIFSVLTALVPRSLKVT